MNKTTLQSAFGLAIAALVWVYTHVSASTQQILAYVGVGSVLVALMWGLWKFRAVPERKSEPPEKAPLDV